MVRSSLIHYSKVYRFLYPPEWKCYTTDSCTYLLEGCREPGHLRLSLSAPHVQLVCHVPSGQKVLLHLVLFLLQLAALLLELVTPLACFHYLVPQGRCSVSFVDMYVYVNKKCWITSTCVHWCMKVSSSFYHLGLICFNDQILLST